MFLLTVPSSPSSSCTSRDSPWSLSACQTCVDTARKNNHTIKDEWKAHLKGLLSHSTRCAVNISATYFFVYFIPSLPEALDAGGAQGYGDVEGTVQVVVLVAVVGDLDEVLNHYSSLAGSPALQDLSGHPGCHLRTNKGK